MRRVSSQPARPGLSVLSIQYGLARRRHAAESPILNTQYPIPNTPPRSKRESGLPAPTPDGAGPTGKAGFTLLELIVVMAILSILTVAVVLVVDPLEMIARANDTTRLSDLATTDDALQFAVANGPSPEKGGVDLDGGNTNTCAGELSQTVYVSVPNSETPPVNLPTGWSYEQVSAANLSNINGSGWIPVDFTNSGITTSSISNLPIDPTNTFASGYYYTYVCTRNPHFELTARMASDKYWTGGDEDKASTDGGDDPLVYEAGTNIDINPLGPIGYWALDEGVGTSTADNSGNSNGGTLVGSTWESAALCIANGCMSFLGNQPAGLTETNKERVVILDSTSLEPTTVWSVSGWIYKDVDNQTGNGAALFWKGNNQQIAVEMISTNIRVNAGGAWVAIQANNVPNNRWVYVVVTYDNSGSNGELRIYIDGIESASATGVAEPIHGFADVWIGERGDHLQHTFIGRIDEVGLYDRALSPQEIVVMFNSLSP